MESKTPMQELIDWINNPMDDLHSLLSKAKEVRDTTESTLIAEHRMMKKALQKIKSVMPDGIASETLKNITL